MAIVKWHYHLNLHFFLSYTLHIGQWWPRGPSTAFQMQGLIFLYMIKQTKCHLSKGNFSSFSKHAWLSLQARDANQQHFPASGAAYDMLLCQGTHGAEGDVQGPPSDGQTHPLKQALIGNRIYNTFQDLPAIQQQMTSHMPYPIHISKSAKEKHKNKFMTRLQSALLKLPKTAFEGLDSIIQAAHHCSTASLHREPIDWSHGKRSQRHQRGLYALLVLLSSSAFNLQGCQSCAIQDQ